MIASAQFTIISICDVVTSDTPPDNPYEGQLWVDTTVTPPETKVWNGSSWILQNGMETIRTEISTLKTKDAEFQQSVDGLNSYVSTLTETVETVSGEQGTVSERVLNAENRISQLQHTIDGLSVTVEEQYIGGINYVQNSAGLNGITDDWSYSGSLSVDSSTDTQNNTISDSCFLLGAYTSFYQYIQGVVPGTYTVSIRAKKTSAMSAYFYVTYNGNKTKYKARTAWDAKVFPAAKGSTSGSITVTHDANGTKSITVGFSTRVYIYGPQEYGGSMTLTAIDRTAPTVTFSTSAVTAYGFKISASSSATADIWQYSTNNGSNWTQFYTTAGTSASVTLSSLSPNTSYTVKVRARKKSNQVYGTSGSATVKTLGGAVVNSVSTVTADNATVSIIINTTVYEASYSYTLAIKNGSSTYLTISGLSWSKGTANRTVTLTAAQRTTLLNAMASIKSFTGAFAVTTYSGSTQIGSTSSKTATVQTTSANSAPTLSGFTYEDSYSTTTNITGNNQLFVQSHSTLKVTPGTATAKNGASISNYTASCNGVSVSNTSGSAITVGKIAKSGSVTVTLTVTDSRGYTASVSKAITVIAYAKPKLSSVTLRRTNEIEAEMQLKFNGSISAISVDGTQKNSVQYVRYRYKKTSETSYSSYTSILSSTTRSGTSFSFSNLELCNLDAGASYDFHLQIQDRLFSLSSLDVYFVVPQGTPLIALRKKKVGINTPNPQATLDVGGDMRVNGSSLADFVIQQGTSGIWTYRKWKSGIAECWGRKSVSTAIGNAWGNLYTSGSLSALNVSFPFTFASVPTITANLTCNGTGAILMVPGSSPAPSVSSTGVYELARGSAQSTSYTYWVNFYVIGKV